MKYIPRQKEMTQSETPTFSRTVCPVLIVVLHTFTIKSFALRCNIVSGYLSPKIPTYYSLMKDAFIVQIVYILDREKTSMRSLLKGISDGPISSGFLSFFGCLSRKNLCSSSLCQSGSIKWYSTPYCYHPWRPSVAGTIELVICCRGQKIKADLYISKHFNPQVKGLIVVIWAKGLGYGALEEH